MPESTSPALYVRPARFARSLTALHALSDPANLVLLPASLGSLLIVTVDAGVRLAIVLALTVILLIAGRLRRAVAISALLLAAFAAAALLHITAVTVPPPHPPLHRGP